VNSNRWWAVCVVASDVAAVVVVGWSPVLLLVAVWQVAFLAADAALVGAEATIDLYESSLRHPANVPLSQQLDALEVLWEKENGD
jgi:hypothetical protein